MKERMPVLFVGHGSPMNAIEDNEFSRGWAALGASLPRPKAILAVSAHYLTAGTEFCGAAKPKTVYDMYGFPRALYEAVYPAPGDPALARRAQALAGGRVTEDFGIDHGVWSVLRHMFPAADIPVVAMSVDADVSPEAHLRLGAALRPLREEGVLILCSGNVVHNLALLDWDRPDGFPWADEFDGWVKDRVLSGDAAALARWQDAGPCAKNAFYTEEHYLPLLYALGAAGDGQTVSLWNDARVMGALSMTCYRFSD